MIRFPQKRGVAGRAGFTLLEMLLAIALIAVTGTMFLVSIDTLGRTSPADEFEGSFWRAMAQARERALTSRREVAIAWDEENHCFVIASVAGTTSVPVAEVDSKESYSAVFSEEVAADDFVLVRGVLVTRREVPAVRVFPDGSCQAFAVEFTLGETSHQIVVDPWTGAPLLPTEDAQTGGRS